MKKVKIDHLIIFATSSILASAGYAIFIGSVMAACVGFGLSLIVILGLRFVVSYNDLEKDNKELDYENCKLRIISKILENRIDRYKHALSDNKIKLENSDELNRRLLGQISELTQEVHSDKTKDAIIDSLKKRVKNINDQYHGKYFGDKPRATTLEDVKRLTGEL